MKFVFYWIALFILMTSSVFAQNDSISPLIRMKHKFLKQQVLPASLITAGSLLNIGTVKYEIQKKIPDTNFHLDNYFQYVPVGQMYLYDLMGLKHQNSVFVQTKYLAVSLVSTSLIVHSLKHITKVQRPVGGRTSFPSGHTTMAFMGATVLYHEFKDTEPLIACSGFVFATTTGILRMANNAHWLPDVLAGAGIGILTVNLVYHFKPLENFQPFKKEKDLTVLPIISPNSFGFQCRF